MPKSTAKTAEAEPKVVKEILLKDGQFTGAQMPFEQWLQEKYPDAVVDIREVDFTVVKYTDDTVAGSEVIQSLWDEFNHI